MKSAPHKSALNLDDTSEGENVYRLSPGKSDQFYFHQALVRSYLPWDSSVLTRVSSVMEYRPLFFYVNSPTFQKDQLRHPLAFESAATLQQQVREEYALRWKQLREFALYYPGHVELLRLLFFFTHVRNPNRVFHDMVELKVRPDSPFYDPHFHYQESREILKLYRSFPGFLKYKLFEFEPLKSNLQ